MKRYEDLINQTFEFPKEEFNVVDNELHFHDIPLMDIIKEYGTPLKLSYLPKISQNIKKAKRMFRSAMKKHNYNGSYMYCYCTKSSHFSFVLQEALRNDIHLETSSAYDLEIVRKLHEKGSIDKDMYIVCNGFKRPLYKQYISEIINEGFTNCIPVLDTLNEIDYYLEHTKKPIQVGIRVAADEEPNFEFYTSRLGVRYGDVNRLYREKIENNPK